MVKKSVLVVAAVALTGLTACDRLNNDFERAAVGAAAGCIAGEVFVKDKCVEGAVIGGAAGAVSNNL